MLCEFQHSWAPSRHDHTINTCAHITLISLVPEPTATSIHRPSKQPEKCHRRTQICGPLRWLLCPPCSVALRVPIKCRLRLIGKVPHTGSSARQLGRLRPRRWKPKSKSFPFRGICALDYKVTEGLRGQVAAPDNGCMWPSPTTRSSSQHSVLQSFYHGHAALYFDNMKHD